MAESQRIFSRGFVIWICVCASPLFLFPLFQYLAVAPTGSITFVWFQPMLALPALVGLGSLLVTPFFLFSRRFRHRAIRYLIVSPIMIAAVFIGLRLSDQVRAAAFHSLALRSAPLVQAIRSYESQKGRPPEDITSLVPEFLSTIPETGMAAYPKYIYESGPKAAERYYGNPWVLIVHTPIGFLNWDDFLYFPLQNYPPANLAGEPYERIADWAYLHE